MPLRTAIYAQATASDPQCEIQLRDLREYTARQGWVLVREYVDTDAGRSGSLPRRPRMGQLRKDAYSGHFDVICVWHLAHWNCGSVGPSLATIREFLSRRLSFVAVGDQMHLEQSNRDSQLVLATLMACATWERQTRQRGMSGQAKAIDRNGRQRKLPDGRTLRQLSLRGYSVREIAAQLGLSRSTVHRALQAMLVESPK
jgi:DNA invertase Pin-like site-specific DNA recombinase